MLGHYLSLTPQYGIRDTWVTWGCWSRSSVDGPNKLTASKTPYADRLRASVQGRLLRADLIKCWKILHGHWSITPSHLFTMSPATGTIGHRFKFLKPHASLDCRRTFFSVRCIDQWNSLPDSVVSAATIEHFKKSLHQCLGDILLIFTDHNWYSDYPLSLPYTLGILLHDTPVLTLSSTHTHTHTN